jgi:branched-chain amino acid transport system permease protein
MNGKLTGDRIRWGVMVLVLAAVALFPVTQPSLYMLRLAAGLFMFIALAQSWNLMGGYTGYLNLGHVVFLGIGAYTSAVLSAHHGLSPFLVAPFAGLVAVVVAAVIGYPALRLRGPYFAVLTLALVSVARLATQNITQVGGGLGILLPRVPFDLRRSEEVFYWIFLLTAVAVVIVAYKIERSRFGLSLLALKNDEEAAQVFGVNVVRTKMIAFMMSAGSR